MTVPGADILKIDDIKIIKQKLSMYLKRAGVCAIWRAEIQIRGQIHFHLTIGFPDSKIIYKSAIEENDEVENYKKVVLINYDFEKKIDSASGEKKKKVLQELHTVFDTLKNINHTSSIKFKSKGLIHFPKQYNLFKENQDNHFNNFIKIRKVWYSCLRSVSKISVYDQEISREKCKYADVYCIDIQILEKEYSAVKRYMQDHTSKSKQGQIGENIGRHWGVINRSAFETKDFKKVIVKTKQGFAIRRWYNRLCIPYIKDSKALFSKKRGKSYRRGYNGSSVFFSNPETLKRMIDYAKSLFPECSLKNL